MSRFTEHVHTILIEDFEIPAESLTADATLREDLGLDSLDAVDLSNRLEEQSGIKIETRKLGELHTLGDLYALIEGLKAES